MSFHVSGYNELTSKIPNSRLHSQTIRNLSRVTRCQVLQTVRLKYSDIPKLDSILADIKEEVKKACPSVITVGRPFRAHFREMQDDHIYVVRLAYCFGPGFADCEACMTNLWRF